jgi:hypothetical protein
MEKHTAEGAGDPKMMRRRSFLKAGALTAFGLFAIPFKTIPAGTDDRTKFWMRVSPSGSSSAE